jgi:hypothetical protein
MKRRLCDAMAIGSAALCALALALFLRSWIASDYLSWQKTQPGSSLSCWECGSHKGSLFVHFSGVSFDSKAAADSHPSTYPDGLYYRRVPTLGWAMPRVLGFSYEWMNGDNGRHVNWTTRAIMVPHWIIAIGFGIPALMYLARRMRTPLPGRCRTCGYDLRATPDRCPECGAPAVERVGIA